MEVSRRERALAAAIDLLGTQGVRALTHARVDERARLPRGSTSNYFRTRAALFEGVVEEMVARELPVVGPALAVSDEGELVEALVALFEVLTGPQRVVTAARLALYVEAAHDEVLGAALARGRARMAEAVTPAFAALGAPDPDFATLVVAALFEGMFLHVVARHARVDARRLVEGAVRMVLAAPAPD